MLNENNARNFFERKIAKYKTVNSLSTAVIALVTVLGLMVGFYFNLKSASIGMIYIVVSESLLLLVVVLFTMWVKGGIDDELA